MFDKIIRIKDLKTGKEYELVPEINRGGCGGCSFVDDSDRCCCTPGYCSTEDAIWEEIE